MAELGFNVDNFHIIGHSLGAHMAGQIGRTTKFSPKKLELRRITGLDPAGHPYFPLNPFVTPLNAGDAKFVDIIHTDNFFLGCTIATGHADFWPNGGKIQPGCKPMNEKNSLDFNSKYVKVY